MSQCEHPAGKCNNADDCAEHICAQPKQKPTLLWDVIDPGWREREVERYKALAAAMPVRRPLVEIGRRATPCGECHLQPGEFDGMDACDQSRWRSVVRIAIEHTLAGERGMTHNAEVTGNARR